MKKSSSIVALVRLILLCSCSFSFSRSLGADIIYQHNFDNLSSIPTEMNSPQIVSPELTAAWDTRYNYTNYLTRSDGKGGKALGLEGYPSAILVLTIPKCKKLDITRISLRVKSPGSGNRLHMMVNGKAYGNPVDIVGDEFVNAAKTISLAGLTGEVRVQVYVSYGENTNIAVIDDFTIYGEVAYQPFHPESWIFPTEDNPTVRCAFDDNIFYDSLIKEPFRSITYTLDETSRAARVNLNIFGPENQFAFVEFPETFQGETTVTAELKVCNNDIITRVNKILNKPGGVPMSDMDLKASFTSRFDEDAWACPSGTCGRMDNGCYRAGYLGYKGFVGKTVDIKVRFKNNVRYFEILGKINFCSSDGVPWEEGDVEDYAGVALYFTQNDFDNYAGALKLPKNDSDEQGKKNLRLLIVSDDILDEDHAKIVPVTAYKYEYDGYWDVRYRMKAECWFANSNTKFYLADAGTSLPVKIESISAKASPEGNHLTWKTSEETNFSHFEVENSEDPRQGFKYLGKVLSGNNSSGGTYHYTHLPSSTSQQYYRLKMIDFDSTFEYSRIVTVGSQIKKQDLLVYPNPAQNLLFLESPDNLKSVNLTDEKGNEVLSRYFLDAGKSLSLPLPKLNSGSYYLKVNSGTEDQQMKRVLVK